MNHNDNEEILSQHELMLLAESSPTTTIESSLKQRMRGAIKKRIDGECPEGGMTHRANLQEWFELNEHISIKILHQDHKNKVQTALWRLKPGAVITSHRHDNDEECLVLEGSVRVGSHILREGDFHTMEKGSYHSDLVSDTGAMLYLKHDMHERLMGPAQI